MSRPLRYPPRRNLDPEGSAAGLYAPDTRKAFSYSRPKLPKCRRLRATFVDDDGRYASINGIIYPVLLSSCRDGRLYNEDVRDSDDYPADWCRQLGLFQVHKVELSSFLTCRIGARLTDLQLLPDR